MDAGKVDKDPRIPFMQRALDCSSHAYKLAGLLCWRYGNKGGSIFPSQETLAADLGVMVRTVRSLIKDELVPIGLKVDIRRGPRTGKSMSFYSFDGPIIPDPRHLNRGGNSGSQKPKSSNATAMLQQVNPRNLGVSAQQFRCPDVNNSGSQKPTNHESYPKEYFKGALARPDEDRADDEEDEERYERLVSELDTALHREERQGRAAKARAKPYRKELRKTEGRIAKGDIDYSKGLDDLERILIALRLEEGQAENRHGETSPSHSAESGYPEDTAADGLPSPPINLEATPVSEQPLEEKPLQRPANGSAGRTETDVIRIASAPTVPKPPAPSRRKPKLSPEEQQNRDIRKSAVWRDCLQGLIDDGEAQRRVDAIDAAPPEVYASSREPSRMGA